MNITKQKLYTSYIWVWTPDNLLLGSIYGLIFVFPELKAHLFHFWEKTKMFFHGVGFLKPDQMKHNSAQQLTKIQG